MPVLLPDEHLLSTIVRAVHLGVANNWRDLIQPDQVEQGDFCASHVLRPVYAATAQQYKGMSLAAIMENHTLWNYFRSFLPSQTEDVPEPSTWHDVYNHSRLLHPKRLIRYRHSKQWRWCLQCNQNDYTHFGLCYWHINHQIPGLSHCTTHPESLLQGACSTCGSQIDDISRNSIRLYPENRCPLCGSAMHAFEQPPAHPLADWIRGVSNQVLFQSAKFDIEKARKDIFSQLDFNPVSSPSTALRKHISQVRQEIESAIPLDVINWLFQTQSRRNYGSGEHVTPLCLRMLYNPEEFIHPLSWMMITWIVLAKNGDLNHYIKA